MTSLRSASLSVLLAAFALGCNGVDDPAPPITIVLDQASVAMVPGIRGPGPGRTDVPVHVGITIHRNGFVGPIIVSVERSGLPTTITVGLNVEDTTGTVWVTAAAGTPPGIHRSTVRATAGDKGSVVASLEIVVLRFRAQIHATSVTVSQGATNTVSVHLQRDGDIPVSVEATTTASGVTVTPSMPGPGVAYIDIAASLGAALGDHKLTITAASGTALETRQIDLVVQPPRPKRQLAFRWCRFQFWFDYPAAFAYANDGEAWNSVEPDAEGMIRFEATDRLRFAEFSTVKDFYSFGSRTRVLNVTADELETMQCASPMAGTRAFTVDAGEAQPYFVALGRWRSFSSDRARAGPHDLIASGTLGTEGDARHRAIIRRSVDPLEDETIVLDFAGGESVGLDSAVVSADLAANFGSSFVHTATTVAHVIQKPTLNRYWVLPESVLLPTDIQSLMLRTPSRGIVHYFRTASDLELSFGPEVSSAEVDMSAQTIRLPAQAEYPNLAGVGQQYAVDHRGIYARTEVWMSDGYLGATPDAWVFTAPDLGRIGWVRPFDASTATAIAASGPPGLFFGGTPGSGTTLKWAGGLAAPYPTGY